MSPQTRAVLIAFAGPAVSVLGILWVLVDVLLNPGRDLTLRYVAFDPGHLVIVVGIALSVVCVPLAYQVAQAEPEELELRMPQTATEPERQPTGQPAGQAWEAWE